MCSFIIQISPAFIWRPRHEHLRPDPVPLQLQRESKCDAKAGHWRHQKWAADHRRSHDHLLQHHLHIWGTRIDSSARTDDRTNQWSPTKHVLPHMFFRCVLMAWAFWLYSWMLIWESAPSVYTCSVWLYQVDKNSLIFAFLWLPQLLFSQYISLNLRCSAAVDHPSNFIPLLLGELPMASWPSCVQSLLHGPPNVLRHHQLGHRDLHDWTLRSNLPHHVVCLQLKG